MSATQTLGQRKRWWGSIRKPITDKINSRINSFRYYQAYGWAQCRLQTCTTIDHKRIRDISAFYDDNITDDAWRQYRVDYLMHTPFASMPAWEAVANRLAEILDDPLVLVEYIGVRPHGRVDKTGWCKVGHACHFILSLLWLRIEHEAALAKEEEEKNPGQNPNPNPAAWSAVDRWASTHTLYTFLSEVQDGYAREQMNQNHVRYVREFEKAEKTGGVNPVVMHPASMTPQQYEAQMLARDATWFGHLTSYFRAMP